MRYYTTNQISENISETPEGFLLCKEVAITRTGYLEYLNEETPSITGGRTGTVLVSRDEEELFAEETIASFEGKPVTIGHPNDFVTPDNWKELSVGVVQNVRRGNGVASDKLIAELLITDARAISMVKSGLREVSCGYDVECAEIGDGRGKQFNIRGNHVALVDKGRAGPTCAIHDNHKEVSMYKKLTEKLKSSISKTIDQALEVAGVIEDENKDMASESKDMQTAMMERIEALDARIAKLEGIKDICEPEEDKESKIGDNATVTPDAVEGDNIEAMLSKIEESILQVRQMVGGNNSAIQEDVADGTVAIDAETISRAEILAPNIARDKDIMRNALKAAYATVDGRSVIDTLNAGHAVTLDSGDDLTTIFIAASELLKVKRSNTLVDSKTFDASNNPLKGGGNMTADKLNEMHAKFWAKKAAL
jgi:hypothetical protein